MASFGLTVDRELSADSDDPTTVLKMMEEYKQSRRQSLLGRRRQVPTDPAGLFGATGKRLNFDSDESFLQRTSTATAMKRWHSHSSTSLSKVPRLGPMGPDPLADLSVLRDAENNRRLSKADDDESLQRLEINRLQMKLGERDAEIVGCQAQIHKWEAHIKSMETCRRKDKLQMDQEREKFELERKRQKDEVEELKQTIKVMEKKEEHRRDLQSSNKWDASRDIRKLEDVNEELEEENRKLQEQVHELSDELDGAEKGLEKERSTLQREISDLRNQLNEAREQRVVEERQSHLVGQLRKDLELAEMELRKTRKESQRLSDELQQNQDAVMERQAMRERLASYPELSRENESLRMENKLLSETMENVDLLKQKVSDLKNRNERAEILVAEGLKAQNDLIHALRRIKRWEGICWKVMSAEERSSLGESLDPHTLEIKIADMQKKEITLMGELQSMQSRCEAEKRRTKEFEGTVSSLETKLRSQGKENEDQGRLIKRFQRKLLLLSKERDSYKGVLESYEHELTFTGGQFDKDRNASLEKVIQAQKEMIEKLENQLTQCNIDVDIRGETESEGSRTQMKQALVRIEELGKALATMQESRDSLQEELERRALRGDYNTTSTRVLHFRNNPAAELSKDREQEFKRIQEENESLKARVHLLEEGQTKDLTMLVGQKVEEGASSQQVQDLKEQLRLAEVRKERLIEAFRKTSQDFREVCFQLTGYRIDGLSHDQYRLSPVYAESQNDRLLFKREPNGECQLLETEFSAQLSELIDLHLNQQHSIPVFLAAVITDLFSRQTFDTVSVSDVGGDEEEPICID